MATRRGLAAWKVRGAARRIDGSIRHPGGSSVSGEEPGSSSPSPDLGPPPHRSGRGRGSSPGASSQPSWPDPSRVVGGRLGVPASPSPTPPAEWPGLGRAARSGRTQRIARAHVSIRRLQIEPRSVEPAPAEEAARSGGRRGSRRRPHTGAPSRTRRGRRRLPNRVGGGDRAPQRRVEGADQVHGLARRRPTSVGAERAHRSRGRETRRRRAGARRRKPRRGNLHQRWAAGAGAPRERWS